MGRLSAIAHTHRERARNIRMFGIGNNLSRSRINDQVHVLHGDRTQEDLISEHHGTCETHTISYGNLDWSYIGNQLTRTISQRHLATIRFLKPELNRDMLRNTKMDSPGIS